MGTTGWIILAVVLGIIGVALFIKYRGTDIQDIKDDVLDDVKEAAEDVEDYLEHVNENMEDAVEDAIDKVEDAIDKVEDVVEDIKEDVVEAVEDVKDEVLDRLRVRIDSLHRVKGKTRIWLMKQGKTGAEADAIIADIDTPFDADGMDLDSAPFKYTVM